MINIRRIVAIFVVIFIIAGTLVYWFIPWASNDVRDNATSFVTFLATLLGFIVIIYQLRETENSILESQQMPRLQLQVLPSSSSSPNSNDFASEESDDNPHPIHLYPNALNPNQLRTRCALRLTNTGTKAASRIYFTFIFRRKGATGDQVVGGFSLEYPDKQIVTAEYVTFDKRGGKSIGMTLRFSSDLLIYTDPFDRPAIAVVDLFMDKTKFEPDYEIQYRIQSYEGNSRLDEKKKRKGEYFEGQIYPIVFIQNVQ